MLTINYKYMMTKGIYLSIMFLTIMVGEKIIDTQSLLAAGISVFIGFILKVSRDWSKNPMSAKKFLLQFLFSFGLGYFAFLYSYDKDWDGTYKQIFLGFISFISAELVTIIEEMGTGGIKQYIAMKLSSFLASNKKDDGYNGTPKSDK